MTTNYPRLPLLIAYLVDFVRRSFGLEPSPTVNLCQAFHTIFWGVFPVPSALVARLLRFVFGYGRGEAICRVFGSKKVGKIGKVLFFSGIALLLIGGLYGAYLYILEHGWWVFFVRVLKIIGIAVGGLVLIFGFVLVMEKRERRKVTGGAPRVSVGKESFQTVAVAWHYIVSVKRHLCPTYANPLYRKCERAED